MLFVDGACPPLLNYLPLLMRHNGELFISLSPSCFYVRCEKMAFTQVVIIQWAGKKWPEASTKCECVCVCVCSVSPNTPEGQSHQKRIKVHSGSHSPDQSLLDFIHWELIGWWKGRLKGRKKEGLITSADKESCFRGGSKLLHFNERFKETFFAFVLTCKVKSAQ